MTVSTVRLFTKIQTPQVQGRTPMAYRAVQPQVLQFQGASIRPPKDVTVKLPRQVEEQLAFLSQTLQLPIAEIATTAAYLVGKATDSAGLPDKRYIGLVKTTDLEKKFQPTPATWNQNDLPDEENFRRYSRSDISKSEWTVWKNVNLKKLSPSRGVWNQCKEAISSKKSFTYPFPQMEKAGGSAFLSILDLLMPGALVYLPFTLPPIRSDKSRITRDLYNGVNLLCEAVKAKQKDPSLALVVIQVGSYWRTTNVAIDITSATGLFRNLKPGQ